MKYGKLINGAIEYCTTDILVSNGVTYINPSEETILSLGWMPVVESEEIRTDEIVDGRIFHYTGVPKTLDDAKKEKIDLIEAYDTSSEVNEFVYKDIAMWIDVELRNRINYGAEKMYSVKGDVEYPLWYNNQVFLIPCSILLQMLAQLEMYALECYNVTAQHKANVIAMNDIEEIASYNHKVGYPSKLNFD